MIPQVCVSLLKPNPASPASMHFATCCFVLTLCLFPNNLACCHLDALNTKTCRFNVQQASYDFSSTRDTNLGLGNTLSNGHIGNSSNNNNSWQQLPSLETISLVASNEQKGAKTDDATSRENAKLLDPPAETRQW